MKRQQLLMSGDYWMVRYPLYILNQDEKLQQPLSSLTSSQAGAEMTPKVKSSKSNARQIFAIDKIITMQNLFIWRVELIIDRLSYNKKHISNIMEDQSSQRSSIKKHLLSPNRTTVKPIKYRTSIKNEKESNGHSKIFNRNQISDQVETEIHEIKQMISQYGYQINKILEEKKNKDVNNDLFEMEAVILLKTDQIKKLNDEIKKLKVANNKYIQNQSDYSKKTDQTHQMFKLAQELKNQRQFLSKNLATHRIQKDKIRRLRGAVQKIAQKYNQHCQKYKQKPVGMEQFKEKQEQIRKLGNSRKKKTKNTSFEQDNHIYNYNHHNKDKQSKNGENNYIRIMQDIQHRKSIAQKALIRAKRKQGSDFSELAEKLEFLRDEDSQLNVKVRQNESQLESLHKKFNLRFQKKLVNNRNLAFSPSHIRQNEYMA